MSSTSWVFGYGSLVSPESMAATIGRPVAPAHVAVAELRGYERRWNYGSLHLRGDWDLGGVEVRSGLVVSLGLVRDEAASCNGVIVQVDDDELARLDWRERDYERTDVSAQIARDDGVATSTVWTYVPRASAIERYEQARDEGRAAIRRSYWELVAAAFEDLGDHHHRRYAATPPPDVPVADITLS